MGTEIARETRSKSGNKCFGKMTEREIVDIFAKGKAGKTRTHVVVKAEPNLCWAPESSFLSTWLLACHGRLWTA